MFTAVIIEDEKQAADLLENMLFDIDPDIYIAEKCGDLVTAVKSIRRHQPSVVFLDINLPVYSGLQLFDFFAPEEIAFHVVFTTASTEYAVRAFEMSAVDYLLKPLQEEKLRFAIQKLYKRPAHQQKLLEVLKDNLQTGNGGKLAVPVSSGYEIVNLADVYYFKAEGSYSHIYLKNKNNVVVSKNLKYFEGLLPLSGSFFRIHRSFIVNVNVITRIVREDGAYLVLEDNSQLPVTADKIDQIILLINNAA